MIDRENEIYTMIAKTVKANFSNATCSSMPSNSPSSFPYVSIQQTGSYEQKNFMDSSNKEKFVTLTFQIDVYSNDTKSRKTECKKIMSVIDEEMRSHNFRRNILTPNDSLYNSTVYRLTATYTCVCDDTYFYAN